MENFIGLGAREGTLHAVTFAGPCWGCGQHGHRAADCPRRPQRRTADDDNFAGAPPPMARRASLLHPFTPQPPPSLHSFKKEVHFEYAARIAGIEFEYYAGEPGGLVQPTEIVPAMEMQPQNLAVHTSFTALPRFRRFTPGL